MKDRNNQNGDKSLGDTNIPMGLCWPNQLKTLDFFLCFFSFLIIVFSIDYLMLNPDQSLLSHPPRFLTHDKLHIMHTIVYNITCLIIMICVLSLASPWLIANFQPTMSTHQTLTYLIIFVSILINSSENSSYLNAVSSVFLFALYLHSISFYLPEKLGHCLKKMTTICIFMIFITDFAHLEWEYPSNRLIDQKNQPMIYLIRHAQSKYNAMERRIKEQYQNISTTPDQEKNYQESQPYLEMKFDLKLEDVDITEEGMKQCEEAAEKLINNKIDVDLVIVSPLRRALATCDCIFKIYKRKIPKKEKLHIVVDPDFREIFESACDIGSRLRESMKDFPDFDYSLIGNPDYWYIQSLGDQEMRQKLIEKLKGHEDDIVREKAKVLMNDLLKSIWQQRSQNEEKDQTLKQKMISSVGTQKQKLKKLSKRYNGIAVVTHSENIKSYIGQKPPNCSIFQYFPSYFELESDQRFPRSYVN